MRAYLHLVLMHVYMISRFALAKFHITLTMYPTSIQNFGGDGYQRNLCCNRKPTMKHKIEFGLKF